MILIVSFYAGLKLVVCVLETISRKKSIVSLSKQCELLKLLVFAMTESCLLFSRS